MRGPTTDLSCVIANGTMKFTRQVYLGLRNRARKLLGINNTTPGIIIAPSCFIAPTAVVQVRGGGTITIGEHSEVMDGAMILTHGGNIEIGHHCSVNVYSVLYGHGGLKIGNNVLIAGGNMIIPNNHNFMSRDKTIIEQGATAKGIVIEDDVWIGHGCTILDGIILAKGTVVAAGSVVTKSTEPYSVVAGIPARIIKYRS